VQAAGSCRCGPSIELDHSLSGRLVTPCFGGSWSRSARDRITRRRSDAGTAALCSLRSPAGDLPSAPPLCPARDPHQTVPSRKLLTLQRTFRVLSIWQGFSSTSNPPFPPLRKGDEGGFKLAARRCAVVLTAETALSVEIVRYGAVEAGARECAYRLCGVADFGVGALPDEHIPRF